MLRIALLLVTALSAAAFYVAVPIGFVIQASQQTSICLSIMIAAVFVRLNRGMPTIDWKALSRNEKERLTAMVEAIAKEYAGIAAICGITLIGIITLSAIASHIPATSVEPIGHWISGFFGGAMTLCISRFGYVIWRDVDIVTLQRTVIMAADQRERDAKKAQDIADGMKASATARIPHRAPSAL